MSDMVSLRFKSNDTFSGGRGQPPITVTDCENQLFTISLVTARAIGDEHVEILGSAIEEPEPEAKEDEAEERYEGRGSHRQNPSPPRARKDGPAKTPRAGS